MHDSQLRTPQATWEEMEALDVPVGNGFGSRGTEGRHKGLADGLIIPIGEEEDTWPPWSWAEECCDTENAPANAQANAQARRGADGQKKRTRPSSTRVSFPETLVGDVSVVKVALCNRSRTDAVIHIDAPHPSAFRVRHRQVRVRAQHYLMLPVYFVPVERGRSRERLSIECAHLGYARHLILSALAA